MLQTPPSSGYWSIITTVLSAVSVLGQGLLLFYVGRWTGKTDTHLMGHDNEIKELKSEVQTLNQRQWDIRRGHSNSPNN